MNGQTQPDVGGYGMLLMSSLLVLLLLAAMVWWLSRVKNRTSHDVTGAMKVRARLALDPGRHLYIVEVAGKTLLLGSGEGAVSLVSDLTGQALPPTSTPVSFADVLKSVWIKKTPTGPRASNARWGEFGGSAAQEGTGKSPFKAGPRASKARWGEFGGCAAEKVEFRAEGSEEWGKSPSDDGPRSERPLVRSISGPQDTP
jgi:flagellar biogenesis protein FliO